MARPEKRLTARAIATIKEPGLHADGDNPYLHVSQGGAKSWIFRWKTNGRLRDMGLGSVRTISLAEARDKALAYRKAVYDGRDPIEERRAQRQAAKLETAKAITFNNAPKPISRLIEQAGATPSTPPSGRQPSKPTSTRLWAICRFRPSMSGSS